MIFCPPSPPVSRLLMSGLGVRRHKDLTLRCDFDHSQSSSGSTPGTTYFGSPGVLPEWLYHFCGSILPVPFFKPCGSTPSRTIPLLREHSHKSGIAGPGALPEWLFCYSGSKIFMIQNFDILLPVLLFLLLLLLWECSRKSGIVLLGVLPQGLKKGTGSILPQKWYSHSGSTPGDPK